MTEAITADPMKKALVQIQGVFAELEKSLLVKKLRHAREQVREKCGKCEGRKGYREVASDTLREIRGLRRKRRNGRRTSYQEIAAILNGRGLTTPMDKPFTVKNLRSIICRHR